MTREQKSAVSVPSLCAITDVNCYLPSVAARVLCEDSVWVNALSPERPFAMMILERDLDT